MHEARCRIGRGERVADGLDVNLVKLLWIFRRGGHDSGEVENHGLAGHRVANSVGMKNVAEAEIETRFIA